MSSVVIAGDTSGSVTLNAQAVSGTTVLTLPNTSGTVALTGNNQVQTQLFTAPGTWTNPGTVTQVRVTVVGGGGGAFGGGGGAGGLAAAIVPVSAPVTVTVGAGGAGGTNPAGSGGTSSFGPAVSSTGGTGGTSPGSGTAGTGTVAVGTALKTGTVYYVYGYVAGEVVRPPGPGNPTAALAYSSSSVFMAGTAGGSSPSPASQPTAAGGVGGAVLVEWIG